MKSRIYEPGGDIAVLLPLPAHAAATATEEHTIFIVPAGLPEGAKIKKINLIPSAAVTGVDANTTHINIFNRGTAGAGTTELANFDLVDAGGDLSALVRKELYAPATPPTLATGTVITLQYEKVGNGLLVPNATVEVVFEVV